MAEIAQRNRETFLDELEEIKRLGLYTPQELKALQKRIHDFEIKINGPSKSMDDFKDYIQYRQYFLEQILERRKKHKTFDRPDIEYRIVKRIKSIYEIAVVRYSDDYKLASEFFQFCKKYKCLYPAASSQIKQMTEMFSTKPAVFKLAFDWFYKQGQNECLNYLHKGLTLHPTNTVLFLAAITFELKTMRKKDYNKKTCIERLMTYKDAIFKNIKDLSFIIDILKLLESSKDTEVVQNAIIDDMVKNDSHRALVWHTIAQREREGKHYKLPENVVPSNSTKFLLSRCINTYETGLAKVTNIEKNQLWTYYLDTLILIQKENGNAATQLRADALKHALEEASKSVELEERHYEAYIELYISDETKALEILNYAVSKMPHSILLWELYLKYYILGDNINLVNETFKAAVLRLKENSESLWHIIIEYHLLRSSPEIVESIYLDAIKQPKRVSSVFKPDYINWLVLVRGIKDARKAYDEIAGKKPYCKELHMAMAKAESLDCGDNDMEHWAQCLRLACEQFGEDIDVWLNYVQFYLFNHKVHDVNEKIQKIYSDAEKQLDAMRMQYFREKYNKLLAESPM